MKMTIRALAAAAMFFSMSALAERGRPVEIREAKPSRAIEPRKSGESEEEYKIRVKEGNSMTLEQEGRSQSAGPSRTATIPPGATIPAKPSQGATPKFQSPKFQVSQEPRDHTFDAINDALSGEPRSELLKKVDREGGRPVDLTESERSAERKTSSPFLKVEVEMTRESIMAKKLEAKIAEALSEVLKDLPEAERARVELATRLVIEEETLRAAEGKRSAETKEIMDSIAKLKQILSGTGSESMLADLIIMYRRTPKALKNMAEFIETIQKAIKTAEAAGKTEEAESQRRTLRGLKNAASKLASDFNANLAAGMNVFEAHQAAIESWVEFAKSHVTDKELAAMRKDCFHGAI